MRIFELPADSCETMVYRAAKCHKCSNNNQNFQIVRHLGQDHKSFYMYTQIQLAGYNYAKPCVADAHTTEHLFMLNLYVYRVLGRFKMTSCTLLIGAVSR